jgi:Protein of unknown function (DUF2934)
MAKDDVLTAIRERAYQLWEQAGRPEGGDLEFWERARAQIEAEQAAQRSKTGVVAAS